MHPSRFEHPCGCSPSQPWLGGTREHARARTVSLTAAAGSLTQENKRLSEPLTRALKEVELLRHELSNYDKDKLSLHNSKARLLVLEDQNKQLAWEHEVLQQRFSMLQKVTHRHTHRHHLHPHAACEQEVLQ